MLYRKVEDILFRGKLICDKEKYIHFNLLDLLEGNVNHCDDIVVVNGESCFYSSIEIKIDNNILKKSEPIKLDPIEKTRTYIFKEGEKIIIENVEEFKLTENGNHRLKTSDGKLHIIPTGWLHIEIDCEQWTI